MPAWIYPEKPDLGLRKLIVNKAKKSIYHSKLLVKQFYRAA